MSDAPVIQREGKNRKSLRLKVELLEKAIETGEISDTIKKMKKVADVAAWEDADQGLTSWTSFSVTAPGGLYPDLAGRLADALKKLAASQATGRKRPPTLRDTRHFQTESRATIAALALQNDDLLEEVQRAKAAIRRVQSQLDSANERLRSAGLKPVR